MNYQPGDLLYEGKAKKIFTVQNRSDLLWQEFKNSLTAFNGVKKGEFDIKGQLNRDISAIIFRYLKNHGIRCHYVDALQSNIMITQKLKMIPLEVVVRNKVAGSLQKKFGLQEGIEINPPLVEFYFKKDELNDPFMSDDQVVMLKLLSYDQITKLKSTSLEINKFLKKFFDAIEITLVDFKMEFGLSETGEFVLGDEISPDSCRLWDKKTGEKLDKDRFRHDLGDVKTGYNEVASRIQKNYGGKL
jgi:phosphoribosylaminoimidazole-succinocarboxamide synthase